MTNAMILAAGRGSRLGEITNTIPKALVKVHNVPLLELAIQKLKRYGFQKIVVNVCYQKEQVIQFLQKKYPEVIISEETELLETGGGIWHARPHLDDDYFLVVNVDILHNLDLRWLESIHKNHENAIATLAVRHRTSSRYLLFETTRLCGWRSVPQEETRMSYPAKSVEELSFMGIQILSPQIFDLYPHSGRFSIIDTYLDLSQKGYNIQGCLADHTQWIDVGKPSTLSQAHEQFSLLDLEGKS